MSEGRRRNARAVRDMTLRPLARYCIACLTVPVMPAVWIGVSGVFSRQTTLILIAVAVVLGVTMAVLWINSFVQLDRGMLRIRRYGRRREFPIADLDYADRRGSRLVVRSGGRKLFTLYEGVWDAHALDDLAGELIARTSTARAAR